jgi:N-carbamoyl-L-amino-acid hydrolase
VLGEARSRPAAEIDTDRVIADLRALNRFGADGRGMWRIAYSPADMGARGWLAERFAEAGLAVSMDGVGNLFGRDPSAKRTVLLGSHSDSVPNGGWLDGALGVIYALNAAHALRGHAGAIGIDVVSFADEEGAFLGCLGSSSFAGRLTEADLDTARSRDGIALREALAAAGLAGRPRATIDPQRVVAYLEAHIEQGPRLEAAGVDIGIVEGIVGLRRQVVRFTGRADHAGTTPMAMRRDAARRMFAFANAIAEEFPRLASPQSVWNIGIVRVAPGAGNIVPSEAEIMVEYRDTDEAILDRMTDAIRALVAREDGRDGVAVAASSGGELAPARMDAALGQMIAEAAAAEGASVMRLVSGAGHDAMNIAAADVPSAMLFVPSIAGRSHDPAEDTSEEDIRRGVRVYVDAVRRLIDRYGNT